MTTVAQATGELAELLDHVPITTEQLDNLHVPLENADLYRSIYQNDPDIVRLADSIQKLGLLEPLIITRDGYIVSGNRRHAAARRLELEEVPVRVLPIWRSDDLDRFMVLLRECNRQRVKSVDEQIREEIISTSPEEAYDRLVQARAERPKARMTSMKVPTKKPRSKINHQRQGFLKAVIKAIAELEDYWPVSIRQIHYRLLNDPPLIKASNPSSTYENDDPSYKNLTRLLTQARDEGIIDDEVIDDETRVTTGWDTCHDAAEFARRQLDNLLTRYWRDLMQSQPDHYELVIEKNTVGRIVRDVAAEYCIQVTSGRGYASRAAQARMVERFEQSHKDRLVILLMTDFDPDGMKIADSFVQAIRDEFGVENIKAYRVALNPEQVESLNLPDGKPVKRTSTRAKPFIRQYGKYGWELEAVEPDQLQQLLRQAINAVIDVDLYNQEVEQEKLDAAAIANYRERILLACKHLSLEADA